MKVSSGSGFRQFHKEGVSGRLHASCRCLEVAQHGEGRGCKTRREAEDSKTTDL